MPNPATTHHDIARTCALLGGQESFRTPIRTRMEAHILISGRVIDSGMIHVVRPGDVPNPDWLAPGTPNRIQQMFGDALLVGYRFVLIPSAVSRHSWHLIFDAARPVADYDDVTQERFALDPRLQA